MSTWPTRLAVVVLAVAAALLGGAMPASAASSTSCPGYKVVVHRTFLGQHYTFHLRIQQIQAQGISCRASHKLIRRADNALLKTGGNVGVYYPVSPWQCEQFRPYAGPHFLQNEDCKRSGGYLSWQEKQLSAMKT